MALASCAIAMSCSDDDSNAPEKDAPAAPEQTPDEGGSDSSNAPEFNYDIEPYGGEMADDAAEDVAGTDEDIYWEANTFDRTVTVNYSGETATVTSTDESIICQTTGAQVTVDLLTNSVKSVEIVLTGKSDNGQLKVYGDKKFKLTFNGVELTSATGPAINNQCKKRVFAHIAEGTTNRLTDAATYADDAYYIAGSDASAEDRKGCLFSEGNIILSGSGALIVNGKSKHGIATDGCLRVRKGVTLAVTDAAKNAIHVKGSSSDSTGIQIDGGLIYAHTSATAGKCLKTDQSVEIYGGKLVLSTSGGSEFDEEDNDTSSPACIKTDGNVTIAGGILTLKSTGEGGKGINADGNLSVSGGLTTVTTTGGKYIYNEALDLTSSPKGVKADGDIVINGGEMNISVTGKSDGSEGLESKSTITIDDGSVYIYAYDDAMNASSSITVNGGKVYCYAVNNDGIDSNGTLTVNGGLVIASGCDVPEEGFDCDRSDLFRVDGGVLIGTGGAAVSPTQSSKQNTLIYNGLSCSMGDVISIIKSDGTPLLTYEIPRTLRQMSLLISSPELTSGTYTLVKSGTLTSPTESWNGWMAGGSWSGGTDVGTFTVSGSVTSVGSSSGPNGGGAGGPRH